MDRTINRGILKENTAMRISSSTTRSCPRKKSSTNSGAKHRKSSEDRSTGKPIKKASTAAATLQGIPEGQLSEEKEDDIEGSEDASKSSFPWKAERTDVPVLYTEENEEQEEEPK